MLSSIKYIGGLCLLFFVCHCSNIEARLSTVDELKLGISHIDAQRYIDDGGIDRKEADALIRGIDLTGIDDIYLDQDQEDGSWIATGVGFDKKKKTWFLMFIYLRHY